MTLQEAETKLSELNNHIAELLKEREKALKEWSFIFNTENKENITCIDERIYSAYKLYLVNGDSKMLVCYLYKEDTKRSIEDFYEQIDTSMHLLSEANGRGYDIPELHRNLVYAKAMEIREHADGNQGENGEIVAMRENAEVNENISLKQENSTKN